MHATNIRGDDAALRGRTVAVTGGPGHLEASQTVETADGIHPELIREVYGVDAVLLTHPVTGRPVVAGTPVRRG